MSFKNRIFEKNPPASEEEIKKIEKQLGLEIPEVYRRFLLKVNGMVFDLCVVYGTEDVVEAYINNQLSEYAPGYLSIGNDNGDRELVIKADKNAVLCGFIDAGAIGTAEPDEWFCFSKWVENGCVMRSENDSLSDEVDIMIIAVPDDRIKFLVEIRKVFSLKIPMSEFRKNIENLPYVIVKDVKYAKAKKLIAKLNYPECVAVTEHF